MAAGACKTVICLNGCLYGIVSPSTKEVTSSASLLAANNQLTDQQQRRLVRLYTAFEEKVATRLAEDAELEAATKAIILG